MGGRLGPSVLPGVKLPGPLRFRLPV
jgi:hypothetical protein